MGGNDFGWPSPLLSGSPASHPRPSPRRPSQLRRATFQTPPISRARTQIPNPRLPSLPSPLSPSPPWPTHPLHPLPPPAHALLVNLPLLQPILPISNSNSSPFPPCHIQHPLPIQPRRHFPRQPSSRRPTIRSDPPSLPSSPSSAPYYHCHYLSSGPRPPAISPLQSKTCPLP